MAKSKASKTKNDQVSDMRITNVIIEYLANQEWGERPEINAEDRTSSTHFTYGLSNNDFTVECYFDADEVHELIKLYVYFKASKIPASKVDEVIRFVNLSNKWAASGHLIQDEYLRYYAAIDVENASLEPQHLTNMVAAGFGVMQLRLPQFMAICFGGKTAEEALEIEAE